MSKAFVIKSKNEEKYAAYATVEQKYWTEYLWQAEIYYSYNDVMRELAFRPYKDCEPVEITIAEGDLIHKIEELKDYIYSYNNETNNRPQTCNEYIDATCKDILEKIKELKL